MAESATQLPPFGGSGRSFQGERKVRLGDVRPDGALRLDALTRYTQDVSNDDTGDAALADDMSWVVRRTTVDVVRQATFGETLTFTTFCSGLGRRWAERRLSLHGDASAHYEVSTLWIHVDPVTGRPKVLGPDFLELFGEAAGGREVSARLVHQTPPEPLVTKSWPTRSVDFDLFHHMNNAAYWATVEDSLGEDGPDLGGSIRLRVEYREGISPGDDVGFGLVHADSGCRAWWMVEGAVAASLEATPLPDGLYN